METKDFFQSKSTWGALFVLLAPFLEQFGITIENQEALIQGIITVVGFVMVVWGQITRKSEINSIAGVKVK